MKRDRLILWLERIADLRVTLACLALMMILVVIGTLAQVHMGTFAAQQAYFNSVWIYAGFGDLRIPLFPGGLTIGALWLANLLAAFAVRFPISKKDTGLLVSHFGVITLLMGQFLMQTLSQESMMPIEIGQTLNYTESPRQVELALVNTSDPQGDEVISIPYSRFNHEGRLDIPGKPFALVIRQFFRNAKLGMAPAGAAPMATQGIGTRIAVEELPVMTGDDDTNAVTAFVEVLEGNRSLGVWLVSSGLGAPQSFHAGGTDYQIHVRPRRHYLPFALTLKEFKHDIYPGTDIPKNFSSLVHLADPARREMRDVLIYMNHPLRYGGRTFYQASFGKNDTLSVFQVVENPAWMTPYVACSLVVFGLALQFLSYLVGFIRRPS